MRAVSGGLPPTRDLLIEHLHCLQDHYGHLKAEHLVALAHELNLAPAEVYEVATFYHHFDVVHDNAAPPPPITVRVCDAIGCALSGADDLVQALEAGLGDGVRVQRVPCVGRCDQAPVAVVGCNPVGQASLATVQARIAQRALRPELPAGTVRYSAYRAAGGYRVLADCLSGRREPASVIDTLERAGLRGMGGAGFPAGRKWRTLRDQPAPRHVVVNIDEGEPGTFKDRHYLESDPHRFLEGALIAAWAIEADAIWLYLRDEYAAARALLRQCLAELQADPPGPLPAMHLRRGAGAYICGEESALIESIEGKRGLPRLRPPLVAQVGLFGHPTLAHNLETLHWVRDILAHGADWFADQGRHGRQGLRSYSVSGRVRHPGVHLAPAGITLRELIDEYCGGMAPGHELKAFFPGGASGGILPAAAADTPLDFDTLQAYDPHCFIGSAAVIVLSQQDSVREAALNAMRFFQHESCGQCTPCRVGTAKAAALMARPVWDAPLLEELADCMADASICGLGQAAPNPLRCVLKYFPEEVR
ncbi:NAD(P)H-dependent oxidoreductase subunit E [Alkalilimnicola ehrlichii MLHE-1]|uniref:NAD(P)H-dependent oxidoreductase subunit E n=1 Tax=Alkalilimnicola ehrlichii TaxID=351052 RepID=UPI0002F60D87|nr:NAD(P)H-dependent oxidoreductase subunit E [Alkalilimnicola ehrlichii]